MPDPSLPMPRAADLSLGDQIRMLSGSGIWTTQALPGTSVRGAVPSTRMNDGPHGMRVQVDAGDHLGLGDAEPATCFPSAVTLASSWDPELVGRVGAAVAAEARALGVSLVLGPGLNIKRHPLCGRNFEYFSEDPYVSGRMAAAMVSGIQSRGIGACLKHFAANNAESHRFVSDSVVDERTLREIYLSGFEHAVETARPWAVMASYNLLNGVQVTENRWLLREVLREEWGFEGVVVSDWGATADRVRGVQAGMDLEMPGGHRLSDAEVRRAVTESRLSAGDLADCAQRVLDHVARCPDLEPEPEGAAGLFAEHDLLAREAAAAGSVLLANDGILPLAAGTRVAVIGAFAEHPRYQGSGSSLVNPASVTTLRQALRAAGVEHTYAPGYDPSASVSDPDLIRRAAAVAAEAEVAVVLVGLPGIDESEGFDRAHLRLPAQHDDLVRAVAAANPRTVVVLANGSPVLMPWREEVAAVLESYLGGQASGGAVADLLYGRTEPGGRLAESFPARLRDVASTPWFARNPRQAQYREGLMVGYRHHTTADIEPLWAFGHGLGYTSFEWEDARVECDRLVAGEGALVRIRVTNTGARPGSDVVQIYRGDRSEVVLRPVRELVGFAKVHLAPGESVELAIEVTGRSFAFYDVPSGSWQVPHGTQILEVARSSVQVVAVLPVEFSGGVGEAAEGPSVAPIAADQAAFELRLGRPVPGVVPVRPFTRSSTIEEIAQTRWGAGLRAQMIKRAKVDTSADPGTAAMVTRSLEELPLRAAATFSAGALSWPVVDLLLAAMNRRPIAMLNAVGSLVRGAVSGGWRRRRRRR